VMSIDLLSGDLHVDPSLLPTATVPPHLPSTLL
jgi:hypothetical protein